jgi:hypothetical protein
MITRTIENPAAICLSMFEDAEGYWAKHWALCVRVRVEFDDGREPLFLTPQEYKALPRDIQQLIMRVPSSPPVEVLPTAQVASPEPLP